MPLIAKKRIAYLELTDENFPYSKVPGNAQIYPAVL